MKKRLKILILCPYYGIYFRGAETFAEELRKIFSKKYFCRIVSFPKKMGEKLKKEDATFTRKNSISLTKKVMDLIKRKKLYFLFKLIPSNLSIHSERDYLFEKIVIREIIKTKPDIIIHQCGAGIQKFLNNLKKENELKFKTIAINASGICWQELRVALEKPDFYVCQTPSQLEFIKKYAPKTKSILIPNGADIWRFKPTVKELSISEIKKLSKNKNAMLQHPIIISTAALEPAKKVDFLIRAVAKLKKGSILLTGDGSQKEYILNLGRSLLGDRFIHLGIVPYEVLPRVYKTGDLFVLCSENEPFGNVFIEAMACGIPVIARDEPDRHWMIGNEGGYYSKMESEENLAADIEKAYALKKKFNPRKRAEKFSWDTISEEYEKLFEIR